MENFAIAQREVDDRTCVVTVEGDLYLASAPQLKRALVELLGKGYGRYVLDLSQVTHMDSMGLGVLVAFRKRLHADAQLALAQDPDDHAPSPACGWSAGEACVGRPSVTVPAPSAAAPSAAEPTPSICRGALPWPSSPFSRSSSASTPLPARAPSHSATLMVLSISSNSGRSLVIVLSGPTILTT